MKIAVISILFFLPLICSARIDSSFARTVLDTLSSPQFSGRGYIDDGMEKAAGFIEKSFQASHISGFMKGQFRQPFSYPVNTFPGDMSLAVNGKLLVPGKDFIISPGSRSTKSAGKMQQSDSTTWVNAENRVILEVKEKLTWSVAGAQEDITSFTLLRGSLAGAPETYEARVNAKMVKDFKTANLMGFIKGTAVPDSLLVYCGHYDHLGRMGSDTYFPGANDNASGISLLLDLAKYYGMHPGRYSICFIAFAGEEAGLLGSKYFVEHANDSGLDLKKVRFLMNLDLMGNGNEGITVVNATEFPKEFALLQKINSNSNYLAAVNSRGKAANSDHYWFSEKGVPAFFIYTLGKRKAYHDVDDVAATTPLNEINDLEKMLISFFDALSN